jgi:hypothetical protein
MQATLIDLAARRSRPMKSIWPAISRPSLSLIDVLVLVVIIGMLAGLLIPGQDFDRTHRYPPARAKADVGAALAEFDGVYHQRAPRSLGWELSILPDGRYSRFHGYCTRTGDRESGYVRLLAGHCLLLPAGPSDASPGVERDFLPVRWKDRRYLVPADRMQEFCDAIIEANEPRPETAMPEHFLVRSPAAQADGIPELPEPWDAYLRENLVIGKIVEVTDNNRLKLDLGSADGIEKGDVLAVQGEGRWRVRYIRVESVQDRSSTAAEMGGDEHDQPPEVGRYVVMQRDLRRSEKPAPGGSQRSSDVPG